MKCEIKTIFILYLLMNSVSFSTSLNKQLEISSLKQINTNPVKENLQDITKEQESNMKFNYSLLIAVLSVCIGFLLSG